ncbi:MAG: TIR domain-containing protein, partial [Geminicoccaceae bacterium]
MPVRVFISYAHEDRAWCERLLDHLGWLRHGGQLAVFDDRQIKPGERWDDRIRAELAGAAIVVPLISPSFMGSRYCALDELVGALQARKRLVPVLVDHVDLEALPIVAIQCLPKDERQDLMPLVDWPNPNRALAAIAAAIRKAMAELGVDAGPTRQQPSVTLEGHEATAPGRADRGTTTMAAIYQAATPRPVDAVALARAEALLATMSVDEVVPPASLPPGSYLPLRRNAVFVGRDPDLRALAATFKAGGTVAVGQSAAVTGLGGMGKTQLACEFAYRYGRFFEGGVFWLGCADPAAIPAEIAAGGRGLDLHPDFTGLPLDGQVALVAQTWHSELPRLLIFDNCEDEAVLESWVPRGGGCRVLVTTRRGTWRPELGVQAIALGILTRTESVELLHGHRPDLAADDPMLDAIAAELGDLPLALHLAGSYLAL